MLDFKGWEKVGEDKKSTTLKHKNGHQMVLVHKGLPKLQQEHLKRLKLAEGTDQGTVKDSKDQQTPATTVNVNASPQPQAQSFQQAQAAPIDVPVAPQMQQPVAPNGEFNPQAASKMDQAATELNTKIATEKAKADVVYQDQALKEQQRLAAIDAQNINNMKSQTDTVANNIRQGAIKPNAYLTDMNTGHKITTALGLLIGGGGAGLAGGTNPAEDFLNKQIDRNIDAQKNRLEQEKNIFGFYDKLYQNQNVASAMAKATLNNVLVHQAEMTAAQLGTPAAQAAAMALKSKKAAENNKLYLDSAGLLQSTPNSQRSVKTTPDEAMNTSVNPNAEPTVGGSLFQSAEASIPSQEKDFHILSPKANDILHNNVQYGGAKAREDYPAAREQLKNAMQADKAMEKITQLFPQIVSKTNYAGAAGSAINPHAAAALGAGVGALAGGLPTAGIGAPVGAGIGAALGEGAGVAAKGAATLLGGNKEIQYQALKGELKKMIIAALPNASGSEIDDIVEKQVPGVRDNPETIKTKLNAIREFIKTKTPTDLLDNYKMTVK